MTMRDCVKAYLALACRINELFREFTTNDMKFLALGNIVILQKILIMVPEVQLCCTMFKEGII
jgi:hypothetical protein